MHLLRIEIVLLILSLCFVILSITLNLKDKLSVSLIFLSIATVSLGCFMAMQDPFLNTWDELYHAMVAKNLINNPFIPLLYKNTVLNYDYTIWTDNYIWLHKQPLFLWQIALSLKIFGVNEFALRIPSILMHAIIPFFIYRIGLISLSKETGFYGALFFSLAYYPLELVAGKYTGDHNDMAFLFYITASFWTWFEYNESKNGIWLVLIGLFAGCAVLVKWLMGCLVFICWSFTFFIERKSFFKISRYFPFLKSFIIALCVFIPWQIYILIRFPLESIFEFSAFSMHFSSVVEGHGGDDWFHFNALNVLYGQGLIIPLLVSMLFLGKKLVSLKYRVFTIGAIVFVYLFFSIAATKMVSFCLIVSPFIFLGIASFFVYLKSFMNQYVTSVMLRRVLFILLCALFSYKLLSIEQIYNNHNIENPMENNYRTNKIIERTVINNLPQNLSDKNYVIFNTKYAQGGNISFMFYSDYIAYRFIPSISQCDEVIAKGYKIAILDFGEIPEYITNNPEIVKIPVE